MLSILLPLLFGLAFLGLPARSGAGEEDDDDRLVGSDGDDRIASGEGDDTVLGRGGDDALWLGPGDDSGTGGDGDDRLAGGGGADRLDGGAGDDRFRADGRDSLTLGEGEDLILRLPGAGATEVADFRPAEDRIEIEARPGARLGLLASDAGGTHVLLDGAAVLHLAGVEPAAVPAGAIRLVASRAG